ncbi:MAG: hypothetical protein ABIK65_15265 [Candidatus Eisenbacteria bacterium]
MIDLIEHPGRVDAFLRKVRSWSPAPPPAVILGGSPNGLSFVRSIGRRGIPVAVLEGPKPLPGLFSRLATGLLLPDPVEEEPRWLALLEAIGAASPAKPVLIPTGDAHVLLVSRNRAALGRRYEFLLPDEEVLEKLPDKREQYRLAEAHGVPVPKTFYPGNETEASAAGRAVGFPCVVKPFVAHLWKRKKEGKLVEAGDEETLLRVYREAERIGQPVMIQEKIPGGDDQLYGLLAYYDRDSKPLCLFTKRKLRQYPVGYGDGSFQITVRAPEVRDLGDRFFREIRYRGLGSIEFKRDGRTGGFLLIEVNPRSVSGQGMTTAAGMDIPWIAYLDIGRVRAVEPTEEFEEGVVFVNLRWDFLSFLENRRLGRLTFAGWARGFFGRKVGHAFFDWRDPAPAGRVLLTVLRNRLKG